MIELSLYRPLALDLYYAYMYTSDVQRLLSDLATLPALQVEACILIQAHLCCNREKKI